MQYEAVGFDSGQGEGWGKGNLDSQNGYQLVGRFPDYLGGAIENPAQSIQRAIFNGTRRTHQAQAAQSRLVPSHVDTNDM